MARGESTLQIRGDWGADGVAALLPVTDVFVLVDVLFAATTIDIAVSMGGQVIPFLYRSDTAETFARGKSAVLARPKEAPEAKEGLSDLPSSMTSLQPGTRVALPAADLTALVSAASGRGGDGAERMVLAGCLRNAGAVAETARRLGRRISVVPVGEHWPHGGLRPAVEDFIGAGAIIHRLEGAMSPEAQAARAAFRDGWDDLPKTLARTGTGFGLRRDGFGGDVAVAGQLNASPYAPLYRDGAFRAAEW